MRTFPVVRDLVTDVSFNYAGNGRSVPRRLARIRRTRRHSDGAVQAPVVVKLMTADRGCSERPGAVPLLPDSGVAFHSSDAVNPYETEEGHRRP